MSLNFKFLNRTAIREIRACFIKYLYNFLFSNRSLKNVYSMVRHCETSSSNKAFIDTGLRPGIATPLVVLFSLPLIAIRPTTARRDVIHKTGST